MTVLIANKKVRIPTHRLLTYEDYARLTPPDSSEYELHNGTIVAMPTPIPLHQEISFELSLLIGFFIKKHKLGKLYTAPMDVKFSPTDTFQPDLLFIMSNRLDIIGEKKIEGAPNLVIEILSDGNTPKEMNYKKYVYETSGVKEYWIINPAKKTLRQYENRENELFMTHELELEDTLQSVVIQDFTFQIKDIFPIN